MRLYGKEKLVSLLTDTAAENRLPHAILLTGEKGSGKRVMAKFIAKQFLCGAEPCGHCHVCSKVDSDGHPDVIYALNVCQGKYTIDRTNRPHTVRDVLESVVIKPNDGDIKIYIFEDADTMSPQVQDTLLKNIEEPQPWVRFIFLCENPGNLLTTIRSRVTEYSMPECPPKSCAECLVNEYSIAPDKAKEFSELMSGNIGKCLETLNGGDEVKLMELARRCAQGIAAKNGYAVCTALSELSKRNEYAATLEYLTGILRDSLAVRAGAELSSCGKAEAKSVARNYDEAAITSMLDKLFEVNSKAQSANLNLALCSAYLTAELL